MTEAHEVRERDAAGPDSVGRDAAGSDAAGSDATAPEAAGRGWRKIVALLVLAAAAGGLYWHFRDSLTLATVAEHEASLRRLMVERPLVVYGSAFLIYVVATGLSLPGAALMTLVLGWFLGFWRAVLLVSFASTAGATLAFLLSRYFLRDLVQRRFGERLAAFNRALDREGAFYLFTLRLIPAVPFFVINVVMGLTPMKTWTYWWVSQVGMLPGTAVYVYAGSQFPDIATIQEKGASGILTPGVITAFVILGLFPLVVKKSFERLRRSRRAEG